MLYRRHANNESGIRTDFGKVLRRVSDKTFFSLENTREQQKLLVRGWRAWQKLYAKEHLRHALAGIREGRISTALDFTGRFLIAGIRWVRGYPTMKGV